ncbi:MAG: hypothetical protein K1W26_18950 [Acetatifactor sp.]
MKIKIRKCMVVIMFTTLVCLTCGCDVPSSSDHGSADVESEKYMEQTDVGLPGNSEEPESLLAEEPTEPESPLVTEPLEVDSSVEPESMPTEETSEQESIEEVEYPSEEEIAALNIPEDMLAYWLVLNNKKPFTSVNQEGQKFFWNEYFWETTWLCDEYGAYKFMIVDMDRDGKDEIVLECNPGTKHILHFEDGEVYGYQFVLRGMLTISEDGIYDASDGADGYEFCRLTELNKDGYTEELLAERHIGDYEIEGKKVTEEEFYAYVDTISDREVECMDYTENMLASYLLRGLSEQEITLVKRIPKEDMLESESDYQEQKQALQLYAGVLTGEQDVIPVTDENFVPSGKMLPIYFNLVDMDGDGIPELIFDFHYSFAWILHCKNEKVFGYYFRTSSYEPPVITADGVFRTDREELSPTGYARITAFEEDGCRIEPVENYQKGNYDRVRYYYYSEETMAQWLEQDGKGEHQ